MQQIAIDIIHKYALELLMPYRQCDLKIVQSLELVFSELPMLNEGEIALIQGGIGIERKYSTLLAGYLSGKFGIRSSIKNVPWENCKAQLLLKKQLDGGYLPVSPWFMQWYPTLDVIDTAIKKFVRDLLDYEISNSSILYRGESKKYPSVRSSLSRYYNTTDPTALKAIKDRDEQDIRSRRIVENEEDVQAILQHLTGKTNSIDFSGIPWVALYFVCESNHNEDGVIWGYDRTRLVRGITVRKPDPKDETARRRVENQSGFLIESDDGIVPHECLHRVAHVPKELKPKLLEFLKLAGIEKSTMFPDIHKFVQDGQQYIPLKALVAMFSEHLKKGDINWVLQNTSSLLQSSNSDIVRQRSCLYFQGLARAISGDLTAAKKDLLQSRNLFSENEEIPKGLQKNLLVIQSVSKSRDVSRIRKLLDYDTSDKGWSSISLSEYIFKGEF